MATVQFPVNLVIPISSTEEGQQVEKLIDDVKGNVSNTFLNKAYYEHPDESQRARLLINGVEVKRGTIERMRESYQYELGINQKTNVTLQEWRRTLLSDKLGYVTISSRVVRIV